MPEPDVALSTLLQLLAGIPNPPLRPNLNFKFPIFDVNDSPASTAPLHYQAWQQLLKSYPDRNVVNQILGAIKHGVQLGYEGPLQDSKRLSYRTLPLTNIGRQHIQLEILDRLKSGRLVRVNNAESIGLVCSPIGTVPKPHSNKLRTIHHLSHPRRGLSINDGISPEKAAIRYDNMDTIIDFVRNNPGAKLWKADLREAFRSITVGNSQSRLLGFGFEGLYFMECALAFGCRSSPLLFNAFAELLRWLLEKAMTPFQSFSRPAHYLDDFFGASTTNADPYGPIWLFQLLTRALGFNLSVEKMFWNKTQLSILGIEIDTIKQTAAISEDRQERLVMLCDKLISNRKATLHDMQTIAGHLQFVCRIAPHGRAFMRRLYNEVKRGYKSPSSRRRIGKDAINEIKWWRATLLEWNGLTLLQPSPLQVMHIWTDASKRALGAHAGPANRPSHVFVKDVSRRHRSKEIHFLEALAVLEALRKFTLSLSAGTMVVIHIDNEAIKYGLLSGSSKDPLTQTLLWEIFSWCLFHNLNTTAVRIDTKENILADALSRRKFSFIQNSFPVAHNHLCSMRQSRADQAQENRQACQPISHRTLEGPIMQLN